MVDLKMYKHNNNYYLKPIFIFAMISSLAACSNYRVQDQMPVESLAEITQYHLSDGFITFSTIGYGCTFYNNFKIKTSDLRSNTLEVVKILPDNCNMTPRDISLVYSFRHLGLDFENEIHVKNLMPAPPLTDLTVK